MAIKDQIQSDIKTAMLSGDKAKVQALNGLKSALLYAEVESGKREKGLSEDEVVRVLAKEAKKRQESIELYKQGGNIEQAEAESFEKQLIESYLPKTLNDDELIAVIDTAIAKLDTPSPKDMGKIIQQVKQEAGPVADGAKIAQLVRDRLPS